MIPSRGPHLGSGPKHERAMLANLARSLFEHGRIRTTEAKAKRLRPFAEKLITSGKRSDVNSRRRVLAVIEDRSVVHKLFADIAPRYQGRPGGYTRVLKLGPRAGDAAPMALIELVDAPAETQQGATGEDQRKRRGLRRRRSRGGETAVRQGHDEAPGSQAADDKPVDDTEGALPSVSSGEEHESPPLQEPDATVPQDAPGDDAEGEEPQQPRG